MKKIRAVKLNHFLAEYCIQGTPMVWITPPTVF